MSLNICKMEDAHPQRGWRVCFGGHSNPDQHEWVHMVQYALLERAESELVVARTSASLVKVKLNGVRELIRLHDQQNQTEQV